MECRLVRNTYYAVYALQYRAIFSQSLELVSVNMWLRRQRCAEAEGSNKAKINHLTDFTHPSPPPFLFPFSLHQHHVYFYDVQTLISTDGTK